jgi:hypothetical protein
MMSAFQIPSYSPGRLALASALPGTANAPTTDTATIDSNARVRLKWAKKPSAWAEAGIFSVLAEPAREGLLAQTKPFYGSLLPIWPGSAISPTFIARLIKGCRVDVPAGYLVSEITKHFQRSI